MAYPEGPIKDFIESLAVATRSGKLNWVAEDHFTFVLKGAQGLVRVASLDEDDGHPFQLTIYRKDGSEVVSYETLLGDSYAVWENTIASIYEAARRKALGIDDVIESLAKEFQLPTSADEDIPF